MDTKMKKLLIALCLLLMVGCTTTGQAYLPHTSRVFHAKKSCVGCYDPNPIVFQSVQAAANSSGIAPCSMCVKPQGVSSSGYKAYNYSSSTPVTSSTNYSTPSSAYSTTAPSYNSQSINNAKTSYGNNQGVAENGSYFGEISEVTGRRKTVPVRGYYRKDGTYVRGHYRSPPRKNQSAFTPFTPSKPFKLSTPSKPFTSSKQFKPFK